LSDPRICAAIVERLTFGGNMVETGTDSCRLAHARAQRAALTDAHRPTDQSPPVAADFG
jgi:hypothetical protein